MFKLYGEATFADGRVITDQQVYDYIKEHTRLIDRLNPKKMLALTLYGFAKLADENATDENAKLNDYRHVTEMDIDVH